MRRWSPPLLLLGVVLAGCNRGGEGPATKGDQVRPELARVTIEVKGMS